MLHLRGKLPRFLFLFDIPRFTTIDSSDILLVVKFFLGSKMRDEDEYVVLLPRFVQWPLEQVFGRLERGIETVFSWAEKWSQWRHSRRK